MAGVSGLVYCPYHQVPMASHCDRPAGCTWGKCPEGCIVRRDGHIMGTPTPDGDPSRGPLQ